MKYTITQLREYVSGVNKERGTIFQAKRYPCYGSTIETNDIEMFAGTPKQCEEWLKRYLSK